MADTTAMLRLEEVAARLAISYTQARMLVLYDEKIPFFKVGSRGVRVKLEDLEAYIAKCQVKQSPTEPIDAREAYRGRNVLREG